MIVIGVLPVGVSQPIFGCEEISESGLRREADDFCAFTIYNTSKTKNFHPKTKYF